MTAILLVLLSGVAVSPQQPARSVPAAEAYYLFLEGRMLEGQGDVEGALRAYRRASELVPEAAEIHAELASLYARQGRAAESMDEARRALALDENSREAHRVLGFVLATIAGQRADRAMADEALLHFEKVLGSGARDAAVELAAGRLAVEQGRHDQAIRWLTAFLLDQSGYPEAMKLLADAYEGSGRPADAAEVVAELVSQSPEATEMRVWLAELHEAAGAWDKASAAWRDVEAASPGDLVYPIRRAMALINGGQAEAGRDVLADLARRAPDNVRIWYLLSQAERRAGNPAGALAAAERITAIDAGNGFGVLALAEARLAAGSPQAAVAVLESRVSAATADDIESGMFSRLSSTLAAALQASADDARAVTVLEAAVARAPEDDALRFELAAAYDSAGRFESAERVFRQLIAEDPAHAGALNYLGYLLADRGERLEEAVSLITRALAVEQDNPSYLDSLGWAYFRLRDFSRARDPLERAAAALPLTSVVQDHLGDLYFETKRYREAAGAFDRALSGDRRGIDVAGVTRKRDRARELAGGR